MVGPYTSDEPTSPLPNLKANSSCKKLPEYILLGKRSQSDNQAKVFCYKFETPAKRSKVYFDDDDSAVHHSSMSLSRFEELTAQSSQKKLSSSPFVSSFEGTDLGQQFDSLINKNCTS